MHGRAMTSPVSWEDSQIGRSPVGVYSKRERVAWGKWKTQFCVMSQCLVAWVASWGHILPWAQFCGWGIRTELSPSSRAGCGRQHAKR